MVMKTIEKTTSAQDISFTPVDSHAINVFTGRVRDGMSNKAMYISAETARGFC